MSTGDIKYKYKCLSCDEILYLDKQTSAIPNHTRKGESSRIDVYCPGSGLRGLYLGLHREGRSRDGDSA